jgi:hypothetical protein
MTVTIPEHANHMFYPSDERKLLAWSRFPQSDDIAMQRTIRGHGKELLHIVFSDSFFNGVRVDAEEKRYAGISTVENLMSITSALVPAGQTYLKPQGLRKVNLKLIFLSPQMKDLLHKQSS